MHTGKLHYIIYYLLPRFFCCYWDHHHGTIARKATKYSKRPYCIWKTT